MKVLCTLTREQASLYAAVLNPFGRESVEDLIAALLENAAELRPLKRLIIERTGGNPFFIEEMVQALFDERILVRNCIVKVTRSLSQIRIPPTVQGILAARIHRLSGEQKERLQTVAVIGRKSPLGLFRQVASNGGGTIGADAGGIAGGRVYLRAAGAR
jgi:predicted ATPase